MHTTEPVFEAETDLFPDLVFRCDEVGETLTDEGEAGKRGNIGNCSIFQNINENLRGDF